MSQWEHARRRLNVVYRSASKDPALEATYLRLLKEPSPHEKSIQRDLGRCVCMTVLPFTMLTLLQNVSSPCFLH